MSQIQMRTKQIQLGLSVRSLNGHEENPTRGEVLQEKNKRKLQLCVCVRAGCVFEAG